MKNHWLEKSEQKKKYWLIEFHKHGIFFLKPRRVKISVVPGYFGSTAGSLTVIFEDAMIAANDLELTNFCVICRNSMQNCVSNLRLFSSASELEYYELYNLTFGHIRHSWKIEDMEFVFSFNKFIKFHCA